MGLVGAWLRGTVVSRPRKSISEVQAEFPDVIVLKYENSLSVTVKGQCVHIWTTRANNLRSGLRCAACRAYATRKTIDEVQSDLPDVLVLKYEGSNSATVKGQCGHVWTTQTVNLRRGSRCGICAGVAAKTIDEVQADLPDVIVLKYEGANSVTVKGPCGHVWTTKTGDLRRGNRCGICAASGYDRSKPAWLYFMERYDSEMQIGITNVPDDRLAYHRRNGWELVDIDGPHDGADIWARERAIKAHLKDSGLLIPGKREDWHTADWEPSSLHEIEEAAR